MNQTLTRKILAKENDNRIIIFISSSRKLIIYRTYKRNKVEKKRNVRKT